MQLQDGKFIVTGGGQGMGLCFVEQLAKAGADVVFCDVNAASIAAAERQCVNYAGRVKGMLADVANEAEVVQFVAAAAQEMGGLNGLINNAGLFRDGLLVKKHRETGVVQKMPLADWQKVIDVDLTGPFLCTREFAAYQLQSAGSAAVVINISSVSRHGNPGQSNYSAAKAGLIADTKLWAVELARYGVRVAAVAPGFIHTPILQGMRPEVLDKMLRKVPLRRVGQPFEIWQAIRFIIECDYFTGRCIDVDGGLSM